MHTSFFLKHKDTEPAKPNHRISEHIHSAMCTVRCQGSNFAVGLSMMRPSFAAVSVGKAVLVTNVSAIYVQRLGRMSYDV